jgi:thiol-disulfide isomerase/thioredoxin
MPGDLSAVRRNAAVNSRRLSALGLAGALLLGACSPSDRSRPRYAEPGAAAPELALQLLPGAPLAAVKGWRDLEGRAVVLQFWSTWDEASRAAFDRLDALAAEFQAEPAAFIAVTDEPPRAVEAFLKGRRPRCWVAAGTGASVFQAYRVYGRPQLALVDRHGNMVEVPAQARLSADHVRRLLGGRPMPGSGGAAAAPDQPLAEFYLAESAPGGGAAELGPDGLKAEGMNLRYALDYVFGAPDRYEIAPAARHAVGAYYDMRLRFPRGRGEKLRREFFLKGLDTALGLRVKESERKEEVRVLRLSPGGPANVKERQSPGEVRCEGAACAVDGGGFGVLAGALSEKLGVMVLDETGQKGLYAYTFDFGGGDAAALSGRLHRQLGLRLERRSRKVRVLEITRPEP